MAIPLQVSRNNSVVSFHEGAEDMMSWRRKEKSLKLAKQSVVPLYVFYKIMV